MGIVFTTLVNEPLYAVLNTKSPLSKLDKIYLEQLHGMNFLAEYIKISGKKKPVENNPLPNVFFRQQGGPVFNNNRSMLYYLTMSENSYCVGQKSLNLCNPFVEMGQILYLRLSAKSKHFYPKQKLIISSTAQTVFVNRRMFKWFTQLLCSILLFVICI